MNKRIEKLIVQAGNYVDEVHTGPVPATFTGNPVWHKEFDKWTQFNEKFAQLIVQDCLDIAKRNISEPSGWGNSDYDEQYRAARRAEVIYNEIRQHFGVEE